MRLRVLTAIIAALIFTFSAQAEVNAKKALMTFRDEIQGIKNGLISGKIKPMKALVLLSAINARENEVIISQNEQIIHNQKSCCQGIKKKHEEALDVI